VADGEVDNLGITLAIIHNTSHHKVEIVLHAAAGKKYWGIFGTKGWRMYADWDGTTARAKRWISNQPTKDDLANFVYDDLYREYLQDSFAAAA